MPGSITGTAAMAMFAYGVSKGCVNIFVVADSNGLFGSRVNSSASTLSLGHTYGIEAALDAFKLPIFATGVFGTGNGIATPGVSVPAASSGLLPQPIYGKPAIASIGTGTSPTITTANNHNYTSGHVVNHSNTQTTPPVDGDFAVTVTGATTYTITPGFNVTAGSTAKGTHCLAIYKLYADDIPSLSGGFIWKASFIPDVGVTSIGMSTNGMAVRLGGHFQPTANYNPDLGSFSQWYGKDLKYQVGYVNVPGATSSVAGNTTNPYTLTVDAYYEGSSTTTFRTWTLKMNDNAKPAGWNVASFDLLASDWSEVQLSRSITSCATGNPGTVNLSANHFVSSGTSVRLRGTACTPVIDGIIEAAAGTTGAVLTVPVNITAAGPTNTGTFELLSRSVGFRLCSNAARLTTQSGGPGVVSYQRVVCPAYTTGFAVNNIMWRGGGTVGTGSANNILLDAVNGFAAMTDAQLINYFNFAFAYSDSLGQRRKAIFVVPLGVNDAQAAIQASKANWKSGMASMLDHLKAKCALANVEATFVIVGAQPLSEISNAGGIGNEVRESYNRLYDTGAKELAAARTDTSAFSWVDAGVTAQQISRVQGFAPALDGSNPTASSVADVHMALFGYRGFWYAGVGELAGEAAGFYAGRGGGGGRLGIGL